MNYLYSQVECADFRTNTLLRKAFADHLKKVAKALHDIEWVDSADYGPGDEDKAINECLTPSMILEVAIQQAQVAQTDLAVAIARANSTKERKAA